MAESSEAGDATPPLQEPDRPIAAMAVAMVDSNILASSPTLTIEQPDPPTQKLAKPASWNTIPTELKLHILSFNLVVRGVITAETHDRVSQIMKLTNLMLTSKEMHDLAAGVYYGSNTFQISTPYLGFQHFLHFRKTWHSGTFRVPNLAIGKFVRRLEFHVHMGEFLKFPSRLGEQLHKPNLRLPDELRYEPSFLCFIEPFEGGEAWRKRRWGTRALCSEAFAPSAQWQYAFPALSYLKVVLKNAPCFSMPPPGREKVLKAFQDMHKYARVPLRALNVEVVAERRLMSCHDWDTPPKDRFRSGKCERKDCVEVLRKLVENMIQTRAE